LWTVESIFQRDYNVVMAVTLLSAVLVLVGILLTDLSYALVDPRIRYE
ncbi:MAG: diguanylate cyclase, partial [Gammaproteobacteria bacterium]